MMMDRQELLDQLCTLKKEFEGFPEEALFNHLIVYFRLTTYNNDVFSNSELLRMARILSGVCTTTTCDTCPFNGDIDCPCDTEWDRITDEQIHNGRVE